MNVFRHLTIQVPWRANCLAIYGGQDNRMEDSLCYDTVTYPGALLASAFNSWPFKGTTTIQRISLIRAGGVSQRGYQRDTANTADHAHTLPSHPRFIPSTATSSPRTLLLTVSSRFPLSLSGDALVGHDLRISRHRPLTARRERRARVERDDRRWLIQRHPRRGRAPSQRSVRIR